MNKKFDNEKAANNVVNIIEEMKTTNPKARTGAKAKAEPKAEPVQADEVRAKHKGGRPKKAVKKSDLYKRTTIYIDKDIKAYFDEIYTNDITGDNFSLLVNRLLSKEKKRLENKAAKQTDN